MTECSQRHCIIDASWLGGGCAACCGLLIPYVAAGEAAGTTQPDTRQVPPTTALVVLGICTRSVQLRRPAQHCGTERNPRRKAPPAALR